MITKLILSGLNGSNPLAFLAALGALRVLAISLPIRKIRLAWRASGQWLPVLSGDALPPQPEVILPLGKKIARIANPRQPREFASKS